MDKKRWRRLSFWCNAIGASACLLTMLRLGKVEGSDVPVASNILFLAMLFAAGEHLLGSSCQAHRRTLRLALEVGFVVCAIVACGFTFT